MALLICFEPFIVCGTVGDVESIIVCVWHYWLIPNHVKCVALLVCYEPVKVCGTGGLFREMWMVCVAV